MRIPIELPSLESLPQTICRSCNRSLINGLFQPAELERKYSYSPRCMRCGGEVSEKQRQSKKPGQSHYFNPKATTPEPA